MVLQVGAHFVEQRLPEVRRSASEQQRHMAALARPKLPKTDWMEDLGTSKGLARRKKPIRVKEKDMFDEILLVLIFG